MIGERTGRPADGDAVDAFLHDMHLTAPHEVAAMVAGHAAAFGVRDAEVYLIDLQQATLTPLTGTGALAVDATLAGRAYQLVQVLSQDVPGGVRVWLPLLDGTERLGVLGVTFAPAAGRPEALHRFAGLVSELVFSKTMYGDTLVRARRRRPLGVAAEMQWGLLPPMTFACQQVTIAGALEPAYEVAGDAIDYAVDAGMARFAVFDGMGHGLRSALLSGLAVAAYRNGRRGGLALAETVRGIDAAVSMAADGGFVTAVVAELDTDTGALSWVNVGHPDPVLLRGRQPVKSLRSARPCRSGSAGRSAGSRGWWSAPRSCSRATGCCCTPTASPRSAHPRASSTGRSG